MSTVKVWRRVLSEEAEEKREELRRRISAYHTRAIAESIQRTFPELKHNNVVVFIEGDDIDPNTGNSEIVSRALSLLGKDVQRKPLSEVVEEYVKSAEENLKIHPLLLEMMFRVNEAETTFSLKMFESLLKQLSATGGLNTTIGNISIGGKKKKESKTYVEMDLSLKLLQNTVLSKFVDNILTNARKLSGDKIFLIEYVSTINFATLSILIKKIKSNSKVYVFVDKGIYLDEKLAELIKEGSVVLVSDSLIRFRKLAHSYISVLQKLCLRNGLKEKILPMRTKEIQEFGEFLRLLYITGFDITIVHKVLMYVDSAPGVIFKVLRDLLTDMYVRFSEELRIRYSRRVTMREVAKYLRRRKYEDFDVIETLRYILRRSIRRIVKDYAMYSLEMNEETYNRYLNLASKLSGVDRKVIAKVMYILSLYARVQRYINKTMILSEETVLEYTMSIADKEEARTLKQNFNKILDALAQLGFINTNVCLGSYIVTLLRPLLLDAYAKYIEGEIENAKDVRRTIMLSALTKLRRVSTERLTIEMIRKVYGETSTLKTLVIKKDVLVDEKIVQELEELRKPVRVVAYMKR